MQRVLVTGGAGFVGSYVVDNLLRRNINPTVFCHRAWPPAEGRVGVFFGDLCEREAVIEAVGAHDGVIHLGGVLGTQATMENPRYAVEVNVLGSLNVFEDCQIHGKAAVPVSASDCWMNNPYERFAPTYNMGQRFRQCAGAPRRRRRGAAIWRWSGRIDYESEGRRLIRIYAPIDLTSS